MKTARYDQRAKAIHGDRQQEQKTTMSSEQYWKTQVKTAEDVVHFYELYYPYFPKELTLSIADYYRRIIVGEVQLPEYLDAKKAVVKKWDYQKEIEEMKLEGEINLTQRRLEKLLDEDEAETERKTKEKQKKKK